VAAVASPIEAVGTEASWAEISNPASSATLKMNNV